MTMSSIPGRINAVKEIDSSLHSFQYIGRSAHPHQISWFIDRKIRNRFFYNMIHLLMGLPNSKSSDGIAVKFKFCDSLRMVYSDIFKKSLIPITEMEKLMGKKTFASVLGGLIVKPQGKPTLVPGSDKRPAIIVSGANDDFTEITEE